MDIFQKYLQTPMRIKKNKNKRLKENLLETIIEGFINEAPMKAVKKDTNRVVTYTNKDNYDAAIKQGTHRPFNPATDKDLPMDGEPADGEDPQAGQQSPDDAIASDPQLARIARAGAERDKKDIGTIGMSPAALKRQAEEMRERFRESLGGLGEKILRIGDILEKRRAEGIAGIGGPAASQGESLFVQVANMFRAGGVKARIESLRDDEDFKKEVENAKDDGPRGSGKRQRIQMASDLGYFEYDDGEEAHKEIIAEYIASREMYVEDELAKANAACKEYDDAVAAAKADPTVEVDIPEKHVFCKGGTAGFGKKEDAYVSWLREAYDGGARIDDVIRSGHFRLDKSKPYMVLQSDEGPDALDGGFSPDRILKDTLQTLSGSSDVSIEDKEHYEKQLEMMSTLDYHDTLIVGQDEQGRLSIVHDSNKKSSDFSDPHNSSTAAAQLQKMLDRYDDNPKLREAAPQVYKIIQKQIEFVNNANQNAAKALGKMTLTGQVVELFKSKDGCLTSGLTKGNDATREKACKEIQSYADKIRAAAKKPKSDLGKWLKETEKEWPADDKPEEQLEVLQEYLKSDGASSDPYAYVFIKMAQTTSPDSKGLEDVHDIRTGLKDTVNTALQTVISDMEKADGRQPEGKNGPHKQVYIDGVLMANLHLDYNITNYDRDLVASMGRHAVTPDQMRQTLFEVVQPEGIDNLDSPESREAFKKHLLENSRVDVESGNLVVQTKDGECSIGKDVWRTAGKKDKVSTEYGDCFRKKLRQTASQRRVSWLPDAPQQEESLSPREQQLRNELKKLVRDIAINRLGDYGN